MLGCNFSALTIVLFSLIFGWGSPVTALQILIIKVACDGIPGFSLCVEKADPDIMKQTMTFLVMGLTTVVHVYNCRTHLSIFQKGRGVNKLVIGTTLLGIVACKSGNASYTAKEPSKETILTRLPKSFYRCFQRRFCGR